MQELLNVSTGRLLAVTLTVLDGDGVETVRMHYNEAMGGQGRDWTMFAMSVMTQLDDETDALEGRVLEEVAIPPLKHILVRVSLRNIEDDHTLILWKGLAAWDVMQHARQTAAPPAQSWQWNSGTLPESRRQVSTLWHKSDISNTSAMHTV